MVLFERCIRYSEEHILPHHLPQRKVKFSDDQDVQPQQVHEEEEEPEPQQSPLQHVASSDVLKEEEGDTEEEDYEGFEIDFNVTAE